MASNYPASLDTTSTLPAAGSVGANLSTFPHSDLHGNANDAIIAIETELGTAPSGSFSTVKARLDALGSAPGIPGSFTPAWTSTGTAPALGTGSSVAGYSTTIDQAVWGNARLVLGTSGITVGTGSYRVSLPSSASTTLQTVNSAAGNGSVIGTGTYVDTSTGNVYPMILHLVSATTAAMTTTGNGAAWTASAPVVPAASDVISYQFFYFID